MKAGKFHGFRIAALQATGVLAGVDLKPGDVVTRVNGMPIEHPEEALEAFNSLEVASELRVAYERDGRARDAARTRSSTTTTPRRDRRDGPTEVAGR